MGRELLAQLVVDVDERLPRNGIRTVGEQLVVFVDVHDEMREELSPDARVAVNNSLSIVKQLDSETDVRARVMQVDQSPDVSYADIGGID